MGQFNSMCLTKKGLRLQAKAQTGERLAFSRAAVGCGYLPDNTDVLELTSLIEPIDTPVDITGNQVIGDGTTQLSVRVQNGSTAFYFREIGIFATDPDEGEILYAYSNAGDYADFMPKLRGTDRVITDVTIVTQIGNAENIDVNVTLIPEVLHDEFDKAIENLTNEIKALSDTDNDIRKNLKSLGEGNTQLTNRIAALERKNEFLYLAVFHGTPNGDAISVNVAAYINELSFDGSLTYTASSSHIHDVLIMYGGPALQVKADVEVDNTFWFNVNKKEPTLNISIPHNDLQTSSGQTVSVYIEFDVLRKQYSIVTELDYKNEDTQEVAGSTVRIKVGKFDFDYDATNHSVTLYNPVINSSNAADEGVVKGTVDINMTQEA